MTQQLSLPLALCEKCLAIPMDVLEVVLLLGIFSFQVKGTKREKVDVSEGSDNKLLC